MRKLLIATHRYISDWAKSSINILCGEKLGEVYIF